MLFEYPAKAKFGRTVPKSKLYENAKISTKLKDKFVKQIDKIVWKYKLAPETTNLGATDNVPEIQVFAIYLKGDEIDDVLLQIIDKAINFPIIFQLYKSDQIKVKSAYKRPSASANNKWVIETYFESTWLDKNTEKQPMPQALDLSGLYEQILQSLMPTEIIDTKTSQTLDQQVDKIKKIESAQKQLDKLQVKLTKEKQFGRKADINKQLKIKQKQLDK